MTDLLIFTDLDGTLLDHHDYSYEAARPALGRLAEACIPLIFCSSKTAAEIRALRSELDNRHPFIVENGSAVCIPTGYFSGEKKNVLEVTTFGPDYAALINQLHPLRESSGYRFRGFADMSRSELARITGLSNNAAVLAQQRHASEPLLWEDSDDALVQFTADLQECQLRLVKGGRFYHVMGPVDKADAMTWLATRYRTTWPERHWSTVALGDSPNDRAMLEAADISVTIPPALGKPLQLTRANDVFCPDKPGPAGWNEAILHILNRKTDKGA